jgi:hypothetical protein
MVTQVIIKQKGKKDFTIELYDNTLYWKLVPKSKSFSNGLQTNPCGIFELGGVPLDGSD